MRDGLTVCTQPAFYQTVEVDLSRIKAEIKAARERGVRVTYTHVLVRVAALALAAHPELHALVCGSKIHYPSQVDICLSVSAETAVNPVVILERVEHKSVQTIAQELASRLPEAQENHRKMMALLNRWGWLLPLGILRRSLLRLLYHSFQFRRKGSGTFQVSVVSGVDLVATSLFNSTAILTAGRVKDRVVAVEGVPVIQPTLYLTCSADHRVWNGEACQRFLLSVQQLLEHPEWLSELRSEDEAATVAFAPDIDRTPAV